MELEVGNLGSHIPEDAGCVYGCSQLSLPGLGFVAFGFVNYREVHGPWAQERWVHDLSLHDLFFPEISSLC